MFYVGKGCGDRVYEHAWKAIATFKRQRIPAILAADKVVRVEIIRTTSTKRQALFRHRSDSRGQG
jgi:hypothetical protein